MRIHANDGISKSAIARLQEEGFIVTADHVPQDALAAYLNKEQVDVLLVRSATKVRHDLIDACPGLRLIGRGGVGLDNIDVAHAKGKGIRVVNTPASSSISVAELVMAHLFATTDLERSYRVNLNVIARDGLPRVLGLKPLLEEWLSGWGEHNRLPQRMKVELKPQRAGSELLELAVVDAGGAKLANVVFAPIQDRRDRNILSVRDQNTFEEALRQKRLMTLLHLWLIHRYRIDSVHYVTPTEDNRYQTAKMMKQGIFSEVNTEVGQIIVADVNPPRIDELLAADRAALGRLIRKED